ncbi:cell wall elongation regulator TseB-like domain-containing protein [Pilibacter termitis]|uniref:cell wall elongation regulator TseB-like domain-containing protein n=1 Tax=Pilibacter termitis TaxID=263852 RepID=UPI001F34C575|nr:DUF5590 domain-containing protein [Pilibacter termitis]
MRERFEMNKREQILLGILILLIVGVLSAVLILVSATSPMKKAENQAANVAKSYANVENVDHFYAFTRKETYFTVVGKNDKNEEVAVIVPKESDKVTVVPMKDGVAQGQAEATVLDRHKDVSKIRKANLGMFDGKVVWEVVGETAKGKITYYLLDFKDGADVNEK